MKSLEDLAQDAIRTVESGFYKVSEANSLHRADNPRRGSGANRLVQAIKNAKGSAIICEIKFASPSAGDISPRYDQVPVITKEMEAGGASGLSVLTEPKNFKGSLANLVIARENTSLPIIMKDIVVSKEQIIAGAAAGANAVLLIEEIFSGNHTKDELSLDDAIGFARYLGLEVIVETHTQEGLDIISKKSCDIIGINNRDLSTFKTNVETTFNLLKHFSHKAGQQEGETGFPLIMSESGFEGPDDILNLVRALKIADSITPSAFLIGTSIMRSDNIKARISEFVEALDSLNGS